MSSSGDLHHFPAHTTSPLTADPTIPLNNLAAVQTRIDAVRTFLSDSLQTKTLIGKSQMQSISDEISGSIHEIIANGAALIASSNPSFRPDPTRDFVGPEVKPELTRIFSEPELKLKIFLVQPDPTRNFFEQELKLRNLPNRPDPIRIFSEAELKLRYNSKPEIPVNNLNDDNWETIELGSEELLAEFAHFCDVCGKGFKRDANLRMHMRAHGNVYKTPEALAKPERGLDNDLKNIRFSCPMIGCNRNKCHVKFKALKSVVCVKNHFKRSHCPRMYVCSRCNKKSFSVMSDLRSHLRHCGEVKWKCSCGTSFTRKDKLFGHVASFEGHMPAIVEDDGKGKAVVEEKESVVDGSENGNDGLIGEYGLTEDFCLDDMLNTPNDSSLVAQIDGFFDF